MNRIGPEPGAGRVSLDRCLDGAMAATLATLPLVGCGVVKAVTGLDVGTGIQPAYLGLAVAVLLAWRRAGGTALVTEGPWWWRRWWLFALASLGVSALGLVTTPAPALPALRWARFARQVLQWLLLAGFPWLVAWWLRDERRWRLVTGALLAGLVLEAVYAAFQAVAFVHPWPVWQRLDALMTSNPGILCGSGELYLGRHFQGIPRLRGTACEPLYLGNYLVFLLPWLVLAARRRPRLAAAPVIALVLLLGTWSRGAWLAVGPAAAAGGILAYRAGWRPGRRLRRRIGVAGLLIVPLLVVSALAGHAAWWQLPVRRLLQSFSREDWSNLTRWYSQQAAWRCFRLSPLWGVGWGQFGYHFPWVVDLRGLQSQFSWPVVNDFYLRVLAETGLAGMVVLSSAVGETARRVLNAVAVDTPGSRVARGRLIAAAAAVAGSWSQLFTFSQVNLPHLWVALGLLVAAWRGVRNGSDAAGGGAEA